MMLIVIMIIVMETAKEAQRINPQVMEIPFLSKDDLNQGCLYIDPAEDISCNDDNVQHEDEEENEE